MPLASAPIHPSLASNSHLVDAALTSAAQENRVLPGSSSALRSFRNTGPPIHQIPPEVLSLVFKLVQEACHQEFNVKGKRRHLEWVVVMHVCQRWRNVSVQTPSLWSYISSSYPPSAIKDSLEYSKSTPLTIDICDRSIKEHQLVLEAMDRVRRFSVSLKNQSASWKIGNLLRRPAPILEQLLIDVPTYALPEGLSIPDPPFSGNSPALRHLSLKGCQVNLDTFPFNGIIALELKRLVNLLEPAQLLSILRRLPNLTSLTLSEVYEQSPGYYDIGEEPIYDPEPPKIPTDFPIVSLPSLAHYSSYAIRPDPDLDFLLYLSFPASATINISLDTFNSSRSVSTFLNFLEIHRSARQNSTTVEVTSMHLLCAGGYLRLGCKTGEGDLLQLKLAGFVDEKITPQVAAQILTVFSFFSTSKLTALNICLPLSIQDWKSLAEDTPSLTTIEVQSKVTGSGFFDFFVGDYKANGVGSGDAGGTGNGKEGSSKEDTFNHDRASWTPTFPNLSRIRVEDISFPQALRNDLPKALAARKAAGRGIDVIDIKRCKSVDKAFVQTLKGVVKGDVDWDGMIRHEGPRYRYDEELEVYYRLEDD